MSDNESYLQLDEDAAHTVRVLLVEDDILQRMPVAEYLRGCGYDVIEASTGDEAQQLFLSGDSPRVLFSDAQVPGPVGGFELAEWVRERFPQVKIILTSAGADFDKHASDLSRVHGFLNKPYPPQALERHINRLLENHASLPHARGRRRSRATS